METIFSTDLLHITRDHYLYAVVCLYAVAFDIVRADVVYPGPVDSTIEGKLQFSVSHRGNVYRDAHLEVRHSSDVVYSFNFCCKS